MDELRRIWLRKRRRDCREQGLHLNFPMVPEACRDASKVSVVVAGMANQLEVSVRRESSHDVTERRRIEISSRGNTEGSSGGDDVARVDRLLAFEGRSELIQNLNLGATLETGMRELPGKSWLEWVANRADPRALENFEQGTPDLRE